MNKTKTVEELIKVILEDFHFTKSLDDGPYGISEQWLEEKIQAVFTAAKEEGRREGREEITKNLRHKDPLGGLMTEKQYHELADLADDIFPTMNCCECRNPHTPPFVGDCLCSCHPQITSI